MYKSILVPLDGSKRAEAILPPVEDLAHRYEAEVIFMGVIEPEAMIFMAEPYYASFDEGRYKRLIAEVATYLDARCGEFREMGIKAKTEVSQGPIVESIIRVAEREDVDLIAMASHGRTGLPQVFYGSVAAGVLHRVTRPLLLIRAV
ncbi:MAG: universal stress protein, partial [Anaerolineae bacterium]|nr:universal stress protein [Anaerolineae bacterium]